MHATFLYFLIAKLFYYLYFRRVTINIQENTMKKITLLLSGLLLGAGIHAQILTDGFEAADGYAVNDYIGPGPNGSYWTTWSGNEGGTEDAQVTSAQASTGSNSIYFNGTGASGGPQDVMLDFGQQYSSGLVTYQADFYIVAGTGAYFNFQGTPTWGTTWALNCTMSSNTISIDDGITSNLATGSYTDATWFTLKIEANLTLGSWEAFVDGNSIGVWSNGVNTIAGVDHFPLNGNKFYVDNVMFDQQTVTLPNLNGAAGGLNMNGNIVGLNVNPTVTVVNAGLNAITSFDVTLDYNGNQYTENVTGVNLTSTNSMAVDITTAVPLVAGSMSATATVSNVNANGTDDDPSDDAITITVNPVVPAAGKVVVGEEGTGTWCGWCPRGAVYMDQYASDYGQYWAGIAVHNGDPMTVTEYDAGMGFGSFPNAKVDRGGEVDPSGMSNDFFTRLQVAPTALITNDVVWNAGTRQLDVTVNANFQASATSSYRLACVLTEDGVTGTTSSYNQSNYYSGGGSGPMVGYESLPNPVPAAQMVYDHVARAIAPSFAGDNTVFPATVNAGEIHSGTYLFTLPVEWDENNINIIGMIIAPNGTIDNAGVTTISAGAVGLVEKDNAVLFNLYPNPTSSFATVEIIMQDATDLELSLIDLSGKVLSHRDYGSVESTSTITIDTRELNPGIYLVELSTNGKKTTKRLIVE